VSGSTVGAATVDTAPTPCPSQMTAVRWLVLPLLGHHTSWACVFASARRFFAFPFGLYPKWVMCLSFPLEADFGMESTVQDLFLHLGLLVGDSVRASVRALPMLVIGSPCWRQCKGVRKGTLNARNYM